MQLHSGSFNFPLDLAKRVEVVIDLLAELLSKVAALFLALLEALMDVVQLVALFEVLVLLAVLVADFGFELSDQHVFLVVGKLARVV